MEGGAVIDDDAIYEHKSDKLEHLAQEKFKEGNRI